MSIDRNPYKNHPEAEIWTAKTKEFYPREFVSEIIKEFNNKFGEFNEFNYIDLFLTQCNVSDQIKDTLHALQKEGIVEDSFISSILNINSDYEDSWMNLEKQCRCLINILIERQDLIRTKKQSIQEQNLLSLWEQYIFYFETIRIALRHREDIKVIRKSRQRPKTYRDIERTDVDTTISTCRKINDISNIDLGIKIRKESKIFFYKFDDLYKFIEYIDKIEEQKEKGDSISYELHINDVPSKFYMCHLCWRSVISFIETKFHPYCLEHEELDKKKKKRLEYLRDKYYEKTKSYILDGVGIPNNDYEKNYFNLYSKQQKLLIPDYIDIKNKYGDDLLEFLEDDILRKRKYFYEVSRFIQQNNYKCKDIYEIIRTLEPDYNDPKYKLTDNIKKVWDIYFYLLMKDDSQIYDKIFNAEIWLRCQQSIQKRSPRTG